MVSISQILLNLSGKGEGGESHKQLISQAKLSCTDPLLPYLTQTEGVTSSAGRKLLRESKKVVGFIQDALLRNSIHMK